MRVDPARERVTHMRMGQGREFDLVRRMLDEWGDRATAIGSDAARIPIPPGHELVASTDSTIEGVHFRREWLTAEEIGYRAAASALSDLAAAAADPIAILIALNVPPHWLGDVIGIARGIGQAAAHSGARIAGGDTAHSTEFSIVITALGSTPVPLTRRGARVDDRIVVTGDLGRSGSALRKLLAGEAPSPDERERFVHPTPRIREAKWLAAHGARAAIDISDGLGSELDHISSASEVGLRIRAENVPCSPGVDPLDAMRSGEEYELLAVVPPELDLANFRASFATPLTELGRVVAGPPSVELTYRGERVAIPRGHDHF